jgi:hypothetical protein
MGIMAIFGRRNVSSKPACENCSFCELIDRGAWGWDFHCHRYPPHYRVEIDAMGSTIQCAGDFIMVAPDYWCGEHARKGSE